LKLKNVKTYKNDRYDDSSTGKSEEPGQCARFLTIPRDFREEVERAKRKKEPGDLELLADEARGFEWETEGLRLVGRAQFELKALEGALVTWEAIRSENDQDVEANTKLGAIRQRPGDLTGSDQALKRVLLFTGHRIDAPGRAEPRFPPDKIDVAKQKIAEAVTAEQKIAGGIAYGISGGASGGDILFHQVCEEMNIPTRMFLAVPRKLYISSSVADAGPQWIEEFNRLMKSRQRRVLCDSMELPRWLQDKPDYNIWQRNNLWNLYNALAAAGGENVTLIALWNGKSGDGPGGTADMVQKARERGAKIIILDTNKIL